MITDPLKIILFPGGCGGNFLADWLTLNEESMRPPNFQVDLKGVKGRLKYITLSENWWVDERFPLGMVSHLSLLNSEEVEKVKTDIFDLNARTTDICITHITDLTGLQKLIELEAKYILIWPKTNQYGWIKNTWYKNQYVDKSQFYNMLYHIENYVDIFKTMITPSNFLDFGDILDLPILEKLYLEINGIEVSNYKKTWAKEYITKQFKRLDDISSQDYFEIRNAVNPCDLFDVAILLYLFKRNNNDVGFWGTKYYDVPSNYMEALKFLDESHNK